MSTLQKSSFLTARSKIVGFLFLLGGVFSVAVTPAFGLDLLEQSFQQSKQYDTVVDIGNNKNAVGNEVIRGGVTVSVGGGPLITNQDPLVVRIIKRMLRIMAILGVSVGIYVGITYILAQGDSGKEKAAIGNLVKIAVGVIIALSAIAIINLVQSITRSSINL
ncbi:hypothetical protein KBC03_00265 [Patescibacteria group bacterium]|nr:hypothetical protein [Patescibacteria group bacterium]